VMLTRREFLVGSAALAAGASVSAPFFLPKYHSVQRPKRSRVA
jgi:TAT (twin-arginine translocation) pathway signal sequence